ncbi:MAG: hypothetical protein QNJ16_02540 [Rhodobacter sp.]|nr:hypothetical protein [Rhodobacter sp.]
MPVKVRVFPDLDLVYTRYSGAVAVDDLRAALRQMAAAPGYRVQMARLIDLSAAEDFAYRFDEILDMSRPVRALYDSSPEPIRIAYIAPTEAAFGMARMFETLIGDSDRLSVATFHSAAEALAFLGLQMSIEDLRRR